jgi:hypothetical protein
MAETCLFSKEFSENPGNVPINREKAIKIHKSILYALPVYKKFFSNSRALGVKRLKTKKINIVLKGVLRNIE